MGVEGRQRRVHRRVGIDAAERGEAVRRGALADLAGDEIGAARIEHARPSEYSSTSSRSERLLVRQAAFDDRRRQVAEGRSAASRRFAGAASPGSSTMKG